MAKGCAERERSLSGSNAPSLGNPMEEGEEVLNESEGKQDTRRAWPTKLANKSSCGLKKTEAESMGSVLVCTRPSA